MSKKETETKSTKEKKQDEKSKVGIRTWIADTFLKEMPTGLEKWVPERIRKIIMERRRESYMENMVKIKIYSKYMTVDPINYICTVFRIRSLSEDLSVNYSYVYSVDLVEYNKYALKKLDPKTSPSPYIQWYSVAPALVSQDGEYRGRLMSYWQSHILERDFPKIYADVERYILHKIEKEELSPEYEHFFPQMEIERIGHELDNAIVRDRVATTMFMYFWLIEISLFSVGMQENHINPKFNRIFFRDFKKDIEFYNSLVTKHGKPIMDKVIQNISQPMIRHRVKGKIEFRPTKYAVGQKLRPLNVSEVQEPFNIKYAPWREVYLAKRASDLVANQICPSFPIILDWFYIKNSRKGLFDNEQQAQRLEFSERAMAIVRKLRETQRLTQTTQAMKAKKFLNDLFQDLYGRIEDPIEFTKANLMMSNVTLGFMSEDVGRTFYDIPVLSKSPVWISIAGDMLNDAPLFQKYMWDMCYALLALNIHLGVVHSDLHLNNGTIDTNSLTEIRSKNPMVIYGIMGYWFKFKQIRCKSCIIDFSRAIITPENAHKHPYFKDNEEEFNEFIHDQHLRMISKLSDLFPTTIIPVKEKLMEMLESDFDKIFKIYTAVDIYDFCGKLHKYFEGKAIKANLDFLLKMQKISEHFLTNILLKVINNPMTHTEWPILQVMKECYVDHIIDAHAEPDDDIVDIWVFDKTLKYSMLQYNQFPPWLRDEKEVTPTGLKLIESIREANETRQKYEKYRLQSLKMVEYIAQRHREKYQ